MKKRRLPIPLILLVPIVLLVVVILAGVYRFSLSDEEILAKFPQAQVEYNSAMNAIFAIKTPNPWTIQVPETKAFAFIDNLDNSGELALGQYDDGVERGSLGVDIALLTAITPNSKEKAYVGTFWISNQGSGVFHYVATFNYDRLRKRMILASSDLLGDRVVVESLSVTNGKVDVSIKQHAETQAMSDIPSELKEITFLLNSDLQLMRN